MGRQQNIKLIKTVGQIEYYESKGRFFVRSKPANIKQTDGTINRANDFGKASALAKSIRLCAAPILPFKPDRILINRLNKTVYAFLCNNNLTSAAALSFITGFEFNEKSKLSERFKINMPIPIVHDTGITIQLPAFNPMQKITAPAYTKKIKFKIIAANINFKNPAVFNSNYVIVTNDYNNNIAVAQEINIQLTITKGTLMLLMIALQYETCKNNLTKTVTDLRWSPAEILFSDKF